MTQTYNHRLSKGLFIVFEGIDGVGKTTQIRLLAKTYMDKGFSLIQTKEPTNGAWGQKIREIEKHGRDKISLDYELNLFMKDREEHVSTIIEPALKQKKLVLSDRYYYSSIAYQGALGMDPGYIKKINEERFPKPDIVIMLDASPTESISRIIKGRQEKNNQGYEQEDYLRAVRKIFKKLKAEDPIVHEIDGMLSKEAIFTKIKGLIDNLVNFHQ